MKILRIINGLLLGALVGMVLFFVIFGPLLITQHISNARDEIIGRIEQLEDRMEAEENEAGAIG